MHVIGLVNRRRESRLQCTRKNYRSVTLLPTYDKVFEKLLSQQATAFIELRLNRNLTAYRKRHSTETSLIKLTENWKRAIDDRNIVRILSTDMSKAFDSLHPPLLFRKLDAYGFSTSSTGLIRSYFTDHERKYRVKIGTEITSEWKEVLRCCPQGSTFGPLPWNTFQTDLNIFANEYNLTMCADDHQLYSAGQMVKEVQDTLNKEGKIISKWYESNLLKGNYEKYQIMSMGPKGKTKDLQITMSNVKLNNDSDLRLLGLTIGQNPRFQ